MRVAPVSGGYRVDIDAVTLRDGTDRATLDIGDGRGASAGVTPQATLAVTRAGSDRPYSVSVPVGAGRYDVSVSAGGGSTPDHLTLATIAAATVTVPAG
ncbi:hypothetical protein [Clavibacter nebraskensis]|uniref:Uncharacterized protein n=2 Tax=Clavibacter nebraskensis TaxID=31963 RepID=A0AAI8ZJE9_9MICO|nr:hypothetical protein [Clavibacter nebraskensis]QGV67212.2 hypothetical protein EGX36_10490 [Clavibacter nebraskensis]QGV70010.2 hypothetical protein EGX37_10445 [Clavibacter nebraskensis]QGV72801.2 hypothetical protein EGX35_10445 [Clavibacter nebraskensis]UKF29182.1 hypothetical protein FGQ65_13840 [Clavibacter nebraskensis]UQB04275.1 hypothetical protein LIV34_002096 [Clavibacter nebraskensis]